MAKKGYLSVKIGNPKTKHMKHRTSSKPTKKRKPKLKTVVLKDPKDSFLYSKRVKHNKMMRVTKSSSKSTKKSKKPKKRLKHKTESKDVRLIRSGKISKKGYDNFYKNWFQDPKRTKRTKMSKR
jgi:hypothetical protein